MNEKMFRQLKHDKAEEIVMLLDLFDGKITLTELLETDIPLIYQLRDAKLEIKRQQDAASGKNQTVQLTDPTTLKDRGKKHD